MCSIRVFPEFLVDPYYEPLVWFMLIVCICITHERVLCPIYTHNAQGHAAPKGRCVYIKSTKSACVVTNMLHFWHSKNLSKPEVNCSASLYSKQTLTHFYNVSQN